MRATVEVIDGLSAHADRRDPALVSGFRRAPAKTHIVHGEDGPARTLAAVIQKRLGWAAEVARDGVDVSLPC